MLSTKNSWRSTNDLKTRRRSSKARFNSFRPITLRQEAGIAEAVELLLKNRISCVPIVDDDFKPVGIVSWRDLLRTLASA